MLFLNKKTNYALIALAYLAEHGEVVCSAREIAERYSLPLPLLMNILKMLHQHDIVRSTRGAKGGYQIRADLERISLYDLIGVLERAVRTVECIHEDGEAHEPCKCKTPHATPVEAPVQALHYKLRRFLKDVKLSDLVLPGRRIDVPVELVQKKLKIAVRGSRLRGTATVLSAHVSA